MELGQDHRPEHRPYIEKLKESLDWDGLVRYGIAHWYSPAFGFASAIVASKASKPLRFWSDLSSYLDELAYGSRFPNWDPSVEQIGSLSTREQFTLDFLHSYSTVCLCVSGNQRVSLELGIRSAERCLQGAGMLMFDDLSAFYLHMLGRAFQALGRYERSRSCLVSSLDHYRKLSLERPDVYDEFVADTLNELAIVCDEMPDSKESAREFIYEAIGIYRSLNDKRDGDHQMDLAMTLNTAAIIETQLDALASSSDLFRESLEILEGISDGSRPMSTLHASVLMNLGNLKRRQAQFKEAVDYHEQSIDLYNELERAFPGIFQEELVRGHANLGNAKFDGGDLEGAGKAFEVAGSKLESDNHRSFLGKPEDALTTCKSLGNFYDKFNGENARSTLKALTWYQRGVECAETARSKMLMSRSRRELLVQHHHIYFDVVRTSIRVFQTNKDETYLGQAILASEMSRSRDVLDEIEDSHQASKGIELFATRKKLRALTRRLWDDSEFFGEESTATRTQLERQVNLAELEYRSLLSQHGGHAIDLFQKSAPFGDVPKANIIPEIQRLIAKDGRIRILYFHLLESAGVVFSISQANVEVVELPAVNTKSIRRWFEAWQESYRKLVHEQNELLSWGAEILPLLKTIESKILDPLFSRIGTEFDRLLIIPHQNLFAVPFQACRLGTGQYLGDVFSISYLSSLSMARLLKGQNSRLGESIVIGNPTGDLKMANAESSVLKHHFPSAHLIGHSHRRKKDEFLQKASNSVLLHFAGHSTIESNNVYASSLRLTGGDHGSSVSLRDILFELCLKKRPVVFLNSCESGVQNMSRVDDYMSLRSGFFCAGARAVVSSLWRVPDTLSTLLIVHCFYKSWKSGSDVAKALIEAQRWVKGIPSGKALAEDIVNPLLELIEAEEDKETVERAAEFLKRRFPDQPPFDMPVFWSPYCAWGAPE